MKSIGRKVYLNWGNQVLAVEIYNETPEAFTARTGVTFTRLNDKPFVSDLVLTVLDDNVMERKIGTTIANVQKAASLNDVIATHALFMTQQDLDERIAHSDISTEFHQDGKALGFDDNTLSYWGAQRDGREFLGFVEMPNQSPEHKILLDFNNLFCASSVADTGKAYVPVYLFDGRVDPSPEDNDPEPFEGFIFDDHEMDDNTDVKAINEAKPWIVYYMGTDNASYGKRFVTEVEAREFAKQGFKAGYSDGIQYYNS